MNAARSPNETSADAGLSADPFDEILLPGALDFVARLARSFAPRIHDLLAEREVRYRAWRAGEPLRFRSDTAAVRDDDWRILSIPADLTRRIVEITGPVDRKMIINALNSGADVFMADFEDATAPTWRNVVQGQLNLRDAVRRTIAYTDPATAKRYTLGDDLATLLVRPRGLHLPRRISPSMARHSGMPLRRRDVSLPQRARLIERGTGPYFYLPKLESCGGGRALERCVLCRRGCARHAARHDQGDGAHRDASGRVPDARDPARAARARRWDSTAAGGTTSSASSRRAARIRRRSCPIARRSP